MPLLPSQEDIRKARAQTAAAVDQAIAPIRTPVLAAVGAGDLATRTLREKLAKISQDVTERAEATRATVNELPAELQQLRQRLDPAELRKLVDACAAVLQQHYDELAKRGEGAVERLRTQPRVQRALSQVEAGMDSAQARMEGVIADLWTFAESAISRASSDVASVGATAGETVEDLAEEAAEVIGEAGTKVEAAAPVRRTPARSTTPRKPAATTKRGGTTQAKGASNGKSAQGASTGTTSTT